MLARNFIITFSFSGEWLEHISKFFYVDEIKKLNVSSFIISEFEKKLVKFENVKNFIWLLYGETVRTTGVGSNYKKSVSQWTDQLFTNFVKASTTKDWNFN